MNGILITLITYQLLMLGIGWWASKRNSDSEDFYLGGRNLGGLVAALMTQVRFRKTFAEIFGPDTQPSEQELDACRQLIEKHQGRRVMPALSHYRHERRRHRER